MSKTILDQFRLDGRVALVTGGGRGLGEGMARALAEAGADVALCGREKKELDRVARDIESMGRRVAPLVCDVSSQAEVKRMIEAVLYAFGKIDILINNAGIYEGMSSVDERPDAWNHTLAVNLSGVWYCAQQVGAAMREKRYGRIVNIASVLGLYGDEECAAYCASKGGVIQLTKVMAIELGVDGITVNCIAPGLFETDMTKPFIGEPGYHERYSQSVPLRRIGQPADLGGLAVFLASESSAYITGQTIVVDGGKTIWR